MLSLGKLAPGQAQYYLDTVAKGAEEYYTAGKEAPGQWMGKSAARLGVSGEVDARDLHRLLSHRDPQTGEPLTGGRSVPKVVGFDATFCAPKSVSLLFALGDPEASNEVRNAHDAAVADAFAVYEHIARGRRGKAGVQQVTGEGFAAAAFRHRTSRAADPQLHTHVVIANLVHAADDARWSALDARPLYGWARAVGHLYEAQLRWELTRRLGVAWTPVRNGIADIDGIAPEVLRAFSTRRQEIDAHLAEMDQAGAKATQAAVYATRQRKNHDLDSAALLDEWRARAASHGLDAAALARVTQRVERVEVPAPGAARADAVYRALAAPDGLTARRSAFGRRQVIEAVCDRLAYGAPVADVLALVDGFLASEHVVPLEATHDETWRDHQGRVVPAGDAESAWTTPEMLALEQHLLASAARRRDDGAAVVSAVALEAAIANRPTLSCEQTAMVRAVCTSGAGVEIVEGVAGAGKTFALAAARDVWSAAGYHVVGASLAARTARRLQDGTAITSTTLERLLRRLDRGEPLTASSVIVVDEAAMVGTRQLGRLLDHAERAGAKVVLVGDPCQLPELDAGGAFAGLSRRLGASVLATNRRQQEPWERDALARLRAGDVDAALDAYAARGRLHLDDDPHGELMEDWWVARAAGEDAVMVAARLRDVDDLNTRARTLLRAAGHLDGDDVVIGRRGFAVGDQVLALRNAYDLGLLNGTTATIARIDRARRALVVDTDAGERLAVPYAYIEAGDLTHGYATTLHKAQGATVDRTLTLADDTFFREHAYTALSRGTARNDLYLAADDDPRADTRHAPETVTPAGDAFRHAIGRTAAQQLALDQAGDDTWTPVEALRAERDRLRRQLADRPPDPRRDLERIDQQLASARGSLEQATWRRDVARQCLDDLGPLGRRLHRRDRADYEQNLTNAERDIARDEHRVADLVAVGNRLAPQLRAWRQWTDQHRDELTRLETLARRINVADRLTCLEHRRHAEIDHGIDIGLP